MTTESIDKKFKLINIDYLDHLARKLNQMNKDNTPKYVTELIAKDIQVMNEFYDSVESIITECQHRDMQKTWVLISLENQVLSQKALIGEILTRLEKHPKAFLDASEIFTKYPTLKQVKENAKF